MSKNSPKSNYTQFTEWLSWAKSKYPTLKNKKSKPIYKVER
jgi:hypothetical protein